MRDRRPPTASPRAHTIATLAEDLACLGTVPGDVLFVHSSFKSLGHVAGGAESVVRAIEEAVGPDGLILMPSFNLVDQDNRATTWDLQSTPSTVGWLTECFRRMPGTHRSDHYSHSVAARGAGAAEFVAGHRSNEGPRSPWDKAPWGKTYGTESPMVRAYDRAGKILMIETDHGTSTYVHLVEVRYWNWLLKSEPDAGYVWLHRERLGAYWDRTGPLRQGCVGDASCRLIGIRDYVDGLLAEVLRDPGRYDRVARP